MKDGERATAIYYQFYEHCSSESRPAVGMSSLRRLPTSDFLFLDRLSQNDITLDSRHVACRLVHGGR
jgi:hypothetical protein